MLGRGLLDVVSNFVQLRGRAQSPAIVELQPGAVVPLHSHPAEQFGIGFVLRGMQAPDRACAHCGPDGALVLDIFQPVREDSLERREALP